MAYPRVQGGALRPHEVPATFNCSIQNGHLSPFTERGIPAVFVKIVPCQWQPPIFPAYERRCCTESEKSCRIPLRIGVDLDGEMAYINGIRLLLKSHATEPA